MAVTGCYVEAASAGPEAVAVGNYGYEPMYFNGYMVYYDSVGRPFYYYNGAQVWIPANSPYYAGYIAHYRTYGVAYGRWYSATGHRYHTYRAPVGYYGGHRGYVQQHGRAVRPAPVRR